MPYKVVTKAVVNTGLDAQSHEFSNRRRVCVVTYEYINEELGIDFRGDLTLEFIDRFESELRIRQQLLSTDIIKAIDCDYVPMTVRLHLINPNYRIVPPNHPAPEQIIY